MISRCCEATLVPVILHLPRPHRRWCNASWICAISPQRISSECQDRARCSMTSHVRARVCLKTFICHARRRRNGAILRQHDRIAVDRRRACKPRELPEPLQEIQIDFKDDSTVPADPLGKQLHVVETCNFVDAGTSIWLHAPVREDFTAETAFEAVVEFLQRYGLPTMLTFDRDPRWVGSASGRDFPSAFVRFLLCLGILPN